MNRTDRLFAIVQELRLAGPAGRTSGWLATRFGVSVRTVKRDMAALEAAGTPVWSSDGRGGGYRLARSASLPPLMFTAGEATAVALALGAEPDMPFGRDGRNALAKIMGVMNDRQRDETQDLGQRIFLRTPERVSAPRWSSVLDEALRTRTVTHLAYRDGDGRSTRRRPIEPLAFARTEGNWYLLAWCRRREAGRWFRLDRVISAHPTTETFTPRDLSEVFGRPPEDAVPVAR